jgi:hypothetical protein
MGRRVTFLQAARFHHQGWITHRKQSSQQENDFTAHG